MTVQPGTVRGLALSTHPAPTVAVTAITVVLAAGVGMPPGRIALLAAVMLLDQVSVGLSNDWLDAERDRVAGRRDKPVALGIVSARLARSTALVAAAASLVLALPLGAGAAIAHAVFLTSAWLYNLGAKRLPVSVLPYAVSFGILPAVVTLALPEPRWPEWWAVAAGAALGVAAHFANVLPDLDDDAATGVRGLPHRLGRARATAVAWASLIAAPACVTLGTGSPAAWAGLLITAVIAASAAVIARRSPSSRVPFVLILAAAIAVVALLAVEGSELVA